MTLIGALLTALVMAREWERGTFEALFVTPARPGEILLGKTVPYFVLGMLGLALSVIGSQVLFGVPLRGSLWILSGIDALSAGGARYRPADFLADQEPVRRQPDHADRHLSAGDDAVGLHVRHPKHAVWRSRSSPTSSRRAISSACCRRCSSRAISGP